MVEHTARPTNIVSRPGPFEKRDEIAMHKCGIQTKDVLNDETLQEVYLTALNSQYRSGPGYLQLPGIVGFKRTEFHDGAAIEATQNRRCPWHAYILEIVRSSCLKAGCGGKGRAPIILEDVNGILMRRQARLETVSQHWSFPLIQHAEGYRDEPKIGRAHV